MEERGRRRSLSFFLLSREGGKEGEGKINTKRHATLEGQQQQQQQQQQQHRSFFLSFFSPSPLFLPPPRKLSLVVRGRGRIEKGGWDRREGGGGGGGRGGGGGGGGGRTLVDSSSSSYWKGWREPLQQSTLKICTSCKKKKTSLLVHMTTLKISPHQKRSEIIAKKTTIEN